MGLTSFTPKAMNINTKPLIDKINDFISNGFVKNINEAIDEYNFFVDRVNDEIVSIESCIDRVIVNENKGIENAIAWEIDELNRHFNTIDNIVFEANIYVANKKYELENKFIFNINKIMNTFFTNVFKKLGLEYTETEETETEETETEEDESTTEDSNSETEEDDSEKTAKDKIEDAKDAAKDAIEDAKDAIQKMIQGFIKKIVEGIKSTINNMFPVPPIISTLLPDFEYPHFITDNGRSKDFRKNGMEIPKKEKLPQITAETLLNSVPTEENMN